MTQIVVNIRDEKRLSFVLELLQAFDFVESVAIEKKVQQSEAKSENDFFAAAGIWEGRDVSLESIRKEAWPRQ